MPLLKRQGRGGFHLTSDRRSPIAKTGVWLVWEVLGGVGRITN
ncbi:MAG: hypothetical protein SAJ37_19300 [Oscillatoria sp. PMC 1068.18]|nr:hypothetical protein [Oscillatoria sp. PMC 1076.18]MEC4990884.1 hypothetical protein [Oscillatoria sp. PMC 1068.18]